MTLQAASAKGTPIRPGRLAHLIAPSPEAEAFYVRILHELVESGLPFLVAGGYAVSAYTGIRRETKDLDVFTTAGIFSRLLAHLQERGHLISVEDDRWIGKIHSGDDFVDVIFGSSNGSVPVQDSWFQNARTMDVLGVEVQVIGPTELVWSKAFIQGRERYDGADIMHVFLKMHDQIDWQRLLSHMDPHWEILLGHILNFRWVYPSERSKIPRWLLDELLSRLGHQMELPPSRARICRGRLLSQADYRHAVEEWGFADIGGQSRPEE